MRWLGFPVVVCALAVFGCGGADRTFVPDDTGSPGVDSSTDSGGDANKDSGGGDTNVDTGPLPDAPGDTTPTPTGKQALSIVSGGTEMKSTNYTLITTTGQKPGGNKVMKSPSYTLKGGVVGASQP